MKHSYAEQHPDVDELINSHSELVRKIAWQIHGRARHITEIEDIIQIGYTGLIVAAQNYTPLDGASFASYASIRIRGAIVDYLRKSSNLCRTTIQIKKQYNAAVQKLERQLLRQPNRKLIIYRINRLWRVGLKCSHPFCQSFLAHFHFISDLKPIRFA